MTIIAIVTKMAVSTQQSDVRRRRGPAQDISVDRILNHKLKISKSRSALGAACACLCGALGTGFDLYFLMSGKFLSISSPFFWYAELVVSLLLLALSLGYTFVYIYPQRRTVSLTTQQRTLLGIPDNGVGFKTVDAQPLVKNSTQVYLTPSGSTPLQRSTPLGSLTPRRAGSNVFIGNSTPLSFSGLSPSHESPLSTSGTVTDYNSLKTYWKKEEEKEERFTRSSFYSAGERASPHHLGGAGEGHVSLREYRMATRSPHTPAVGDREEDKSFSDPNSVWSKLSISRDVLDIWTENCRKWIAQTVFQPLVHEIRTVNSRLESMGYAHYQVGRAPLHMLRQLTITESQLLPTLPMILPYLEVSSHQDYVYQRILEIGGDSCLRSFKWNGGGEWNGRGWNIDLPTDSQIVIHCLCSYLDANLVPGPLLTEKTFSQQHFLKTPSKPDDKTDTCIYQSSVNPPHFKVVRNKTIIEIPKGFNNLFYAIIVFLYQIQSKNSGMLGSININLSAVNILWIISNS